MHLNKQLRPSVGADLSRTPPIYRPSVAVPTIRNILLKLHNLRWDTVHLPLQPLNSAYATNSHLFACPNIIHNPGYIKFSH